MDTRIVTQGPITADDLHIRRIGDTIMIHHEDGRRLGVVNAMTGQCRDARRGENVAAWINGANLTVADVIEMTQPAPQAATIAPTQEPAPQEAPVRRLGVTTRIERVGANNLTIYGSVDRDEQIIGYANSRVEAETQERNWRFDMATDGHCPEDAARVAMEPEPAPPRDDGPDDNWGGFRCPCGVQSDLSLPESAITGTTDPRCELCDDPAFVSYNGHLYCKEQWQTSNCGPVPSDAPTPTYATERAAATGKPDRRRTGTCRHCGDRISRPTPGHAWSHTAGGLDHLHLAEPFPLAAPATPDALPVEPPDPATAPVATRRLVYCEVCGIPGTTDQDEDWTCPACMPHSFVRDTAYDLRCPTHALDADAWWCGTHTFWTIRGARPIACPACEAPPLSTAQCCLCDTSLAYPGAPCGVCTSTPCIHCDKTGHVRTACPKVTQERQQAIVGERLAREYHDAPAPFLARFGALTPRYQAAVSFAVAAWAEVDVGEIDALWLESGVRLAEKAATQQS